MNRAAKVAAGVGLLGVAGLLAFERLPHPPGQPAPAPVRTTTAEVTRATVAERQFVNGSLGYAGSLVVSGAVAGTLTWLPPIGTVVRAGEAAYEVDGRRVTLLYGDRPAWRDLALGMSDGADVEQLERNLRDLGFGAGLTVDQTFTGATAAAVRRWQQATRTAVTGALPLGAVTFTPGAIRVSGRDLEPGARVEPGVPVEHATGTEPAVTVNASTQQLAWIKAGDPVVVTLPDATNRPGRVAAIGATTPGDGAAPSTVAVTIRLDGAASGFVDQAGVQVWVVRATHPDVLTVPITALNAAGAGRYEVIVGDGTGTRRVPVRTGLFDDLAGTVEITGLLEGQQVQVPRDA
ncbi:peptidoglycan-binding protein [Dactylosporangium sp. CS-033363]|uniref:peptidoglycan-binding protein n=1 Tax=Dactylosporangium sp. CS-033363 TaxID=3239935 RepID=UPI003D8EDBBC